MKLLLFTLISILVINVQANEENIELYHEEAPSRSVIIRPMVPKLSEPAPLEVLNTQEVTLRWNPVDSANYYALQVSADPIFYNLLVNEPLLNQVQYSLKDIKLESGKTYYWRVASYKDSNLPGFAKSLFNRSSFSLR